MRGFAGLRIGQACRDPIMTPPDLQPRFESAVRCHAGDLFRFAYYLSRDRQHAEDVVQEALLRGWRSFDRLLDEGAVKAWLFSIVRNEFYRSARQRTARGEELDISALEIADDRASIFGAGMHGLEMRNALRALPLSYGEPLTLQVLGGFSCCEIACMLGTSEGAVMTRLTRARQALKRLIQPAAASVRRGVGA